MTPALSIVVPLRNNHQTLPRLLDSIAQQNIALETILVDDCSDEPYDALAETYRCQGMDIRLIRTPRQVYTKEARLLGIEAARAEILTFADGDDIFLGVDLLGSLVRLFTQHQADILHFSTKDISIESVSEINWLSPFQAEMRGWDIMRKFADVFSRFNIWGKLYRRSLWQELVPVARAFPIQRYCEDMYLFFLYALHSKFYLGCPVPAYGYYFVPESASERAFQRMLATDTIKQRFIPYMQSQGCPEDIVKIMGEHLGCHVALQATRWLRDFCFESAPGSGNRDYLAEIPEQMPEKELLRILLDANASLARTLTSMAGPVIRLAS